MAWTVSIVDSERGLVAWHHVCAVSVSGTLVIDTPGAAARERTFLAPCFMRELEQIRNFITDSVFEIWVGDVDNMHPKNDRPISDRFLHILVQILFLEVLLSCAQKSLGVSLLAMFLHNICSGHQSTSC